MQSCLVFVGKLISITKNSNFEKIARLSVLSLYQSCGKWTFLISLAV